MLVFCLERFLKMEEHKAHSTAIAIMLPLSLVSIFIYSKGMQIDISHIIYICIGGVIGGIVGATCLKKISSLWLHRIFGFVMLICSWRIIL